ncbi:glycosyltransferase family 4 protein [Sulfitobacter sp. JB4-11]|uniref:glycosyltransferase family 4 protein n=1 Tax=Sulfitobacter rhodophyticola TaxID=3238304 RepID=UPI003515AFE6
MVPARLLDLTRTLRRAGRVPTGVDRVERAYLAQFLQDDVPVFGLVRTALGYILLDRVGVQAFSDRVHGDVPWGPRRGLARLSRAPDAVRRAESDMRKLAIARLTPGRLGAALARYVPAGYAYYNVGHSNLTDRVLSGIKGSFGTVHVLVHDVIPLEYPQFQRAGSVAPFEVKMRRVARFADRIICNSKDTAARCGAVMADWGRVPPMVVAHLGCPVSEPDMDDLPPEIDPNQAYFVTVGTIEPRKNHGFLLDLWDELGPDASRLYISGARGWENANVFARLDDLGPQSRVQELGALSDAAQTALVAGARCTLFPTLAEGFGLPLVESLTLGTPVICNDLPVFREFLGKYAVYASVEERYLWLEAVKSWAESPPVVQEPEGFVAPTWVEHFKIVLGSEC